MMDISDVLLGMMENMLSSSNYHNNLTSIIQLRVQNRMIHAIDILKIGNET